MLYKVLPLIFFGLTALAEPTIKIGSKRFSENYLLSEIFSLLLEEEGFSVERKFGMGGTMVAFNALRSGEIDIYPDYTGTISEAALQADIRDEKEINRRLQEMQLEMLSSLGFDNSYALIMRIDKAEKLNIANLSDLKNHPKLRGGLSSEFQGRRDGWLALKRTYSLKNPVKSVEIPLTYEALKNNKVDFAEAYTTEPLIKKYGFKIIEDDKNFFPKYVAVALIRQDLNPKAREILSRLAGLIDSETILELNSQVVTGSSIESVASRFLASKGLIQSDDAELKARMISWKKLRERVWDHMLLTGLAVLLATLIAVPLATLIAPFKKLSQIVLGFTGIMQTIPSIALLTFMIPFFGIGFTPALIGLFVYSLLPIIRNTHVAMTTIDPRILTAARGIGLYPSEVLFSVKLPLALPTILTGIRTATTLNIGTATLAAFIGAGGLGEPIVTGLALNDSSLVLQGAIPAALLAIVVDFIFSMIEKIFAKGL